MLGSLAAFSAAFAVAASAFGAHGASGPLEAQWLQTGGFYQLVHAIAVLVVMARARIVAILLLAGANIFAITLYLMAIGAPRWLGAITPLGGTLLIVGWLVLAWSYWRKSV